MQPSNHPTTQLQPWLAAFPREQLLVLFMDDMRTPEATHAQVGKVSKYEANGSILSCIASTT